MLAQCPHCQTRVKMKEEYRGHTGRCPSCRQTFTIEECQEPNPEPPPAAEEVPLIRRGAPPRRAAAEGGRARTAPEGSRVKTAVAFLTRATIPLADNEKVALWDGPCGGTLQAPRGVLQLDGTWQVSMIGNFLGSGILGYVLIRPLFQKARTEAIQPENIERVVIGKTKPFLGKEQEVYHVFQSRDGGMTEVHVFTVPEPSGHAVRRLLEGLVPPERFTTQG